VKIKNGILLSLFSLTMHAANPQLPISNTKSIAIPHDLRTHHTFTVDSSNPGPLTFEIKTTHTVIIESPTLDKATNVLDAYFHTPSLFATLGIVAIGCASFYCGWKLIQSDNLEKFKKVIAGTLMTCGFLAACAPFVMFLLQSRSISV
jgi:hypothetical protein